MSVSFDLEAAVEHGDLASFELLLAALWRPYEEQPSAERDATSLVPERPYRTFCEA